MKAVRYGSCPSSFFCALSLPVTNFPCSSKHTLILKVFVMFSLKLELHTQYITESYNGEYTYATVIKSRNQM